MDTIFELNAIFFWFDLLITWIIRGHNRLISNVVESTEEFWTVLASNLQLVDSYFLNLCNFWSFSLRN